jgi:hypothetical protein
MHSAQITERPFGQLTSGPISKPGDAVDVNPPINVAWGILPTPVIDIDSSTIYIVNWIVDNRGNRQLRLNALRLRDGRENPAYSVLDPGEVHKCSRSDVDAEPSSKAASGIVADAAAGDGNRS